MRFISPKTDFAFKKIFGSDQSKDILISFLNAMIYSGNSVIQDLEIIDPYSAGDVVDLKDKLVFVELPKFTKQLEELESVIDKWIYFIKEAPNLEIIPDQLREIPQLEKALTIANQAGLNVSEVEKLRKQEMALEDARGALSFAKREGREEGERNLLLRLLESRFGKLTTNALALIEALTHQDLEGLSEAIWDFQTSDDLLNWLQEHSN
ncbi:MAG: DUF4351 domain-containing protein [Moorea sp. SIO1F2]|uniref:PD-(D/E)XK nuclease family transposase n=1 Tax=unclassified Moorena TaxID=2683338 RepID=UPI0013BB8982|nr:MULTISPECIES: PD-(D/E)XK nuclease family transposase [unclassified Moorena]NEN96184.1 DUF4351 domain-containing protein [Moorena sp. SIO3I7]NEO07841.1 DUF4351 domain-containing protein [Moorena sp. SIO3I8]NEO22011.1 DUF4351 domain-containing protein [Moorena sp. SIO4A5]NEP22134.1 DUF4351 domain-containing protein [Moorena sp. SIO3I6]NEQ60863.1 DUF4351 domain-containing protein [Moorena sp. SIO4A1]